MKKHVYGPVPSRRLGFSLGIDVTPYKTCSYNCIYCQLKETDNLTTVRQSFFDPEEILEEVKAAINNSEQIDCLTFSGSGEPTLNKDIGWIIKEIKKISNIPVVVLTNGSLLWMKKVQDDLKEAGIVIPSLDSANDEGFKKINCPSPELSLEQVKQGLEEFSGIFPGKLYLEILLVVGINDTPEEIETLKNFLPHLKLDKIQLNTVVRPPRLSQAKPVSQKKMEEIRDALQNIADAEVEIIANFSRRPRNESTAQIEEAILELLERRPCQPKEMAASLGIHYNEILKYLYILENKKKIKKASSLDTTEAYYKLANTT